MATSDDGPKLPPKPKKRIIPEPPKASKAPTIGDKARAGRLLSEFLRRIAQEKTELAQVDGEDILITKAEKMARNMFKIANGYEEFDPKKQKTTVHKPNAGMIALIFDRMEGRAAPSNEGDKEKRMLPKKVSAENKKRLNKLAQG